MEGLKYLQLFNAFTNHTSDQGGTAKKVDADKNMEVSINVGGKVFVTRESSLKAVPGSLMSQLDKTSQFFDAGNQQYRFDRDPDMFKEILAVHRSGELHAPKDICPLRFKRELYFWKIPISMLMPCCWKYFYDCETDLETLDKIIQCRAQPASLNTVDISQEDMNQIKSCVAKHINGSSNTEKVATRENPPSCMYRIWLLLEEPSSSTAAKIWCFFYMFMVVLSVIIFFLWSEVDYRVDAYLTKKKPTQTEIINIIQADERLRTMMVLDPHPVIFALDCLCTSFFILETILLMVVCPRRRDLLRSPLYLMKVLVCLAMLSAFIFDIKRDLITSYDVGKVYATLKALSVLRLLLIFRIKKLYPRLQIVLLSLTSGAKDFLLLIFVFIMTIIIHGGMIYCLEMDTNTFPNTRTAFWWALITMTTIGYGDYYPTSQEGHIMAGVCAIQGLIVIALPIAAIASTFALFYSRWADLDTHMAAIKSEREKNTKQGDKSSATSRDSHINDSCFVIPSKERHVN